jgi:membrane protease YdiL (CAAX protease family)
MRDGRSARRLEKPSAYPRVLQAVALLVLAVVSRIFFDIPVWLFTRPNTETRSVLMAIVAPLSMGLVIYWGYRRSASPLRAVFPLASIRLSQAASMTLMLLGTIVLVLESNYAMRLVWPKPASLVNIDQGLRHGDVWIALVAPVVVGPVTEEFLFRGLILHGFLQNYGRRKALLVSALLFALFHLNPWQFLGALVMGVVFGWWLIESGSLLPCLLGHAVYNLLPWLAGRISTGLGGLKAATVFDPVWFGGFAVFGALSLLFGAWLLGREGS